MTRATLSAVALAAAAVAAPAQPAAAPESGKYWVFVGTYTSANGSKGIYRCQLDVASGKLSEPELAAEQTSPSFLAFSPDGKFLYAVGETVSVGDKKEGKVYAYKVDAKTGGLTKLNEETTGGAGPCHISVNKTGKFAIAANYGGGSSAVFKLKDDGSFDRRTAFIQHEGSSTNPGRQKEPHAHCGFFAGDGEFAYVVDLGIDKVLVFKLDYETGKLTPNAPAFVKLPDGSGPRHIAFLKDHTMAYVCGELDSTVMALRFNPRTGELKLRDKSDVLSTLPDGKPVPGNSTAEVVIHPSGKYVFVSNRGHNSIATFKVDGDKLTVGHHLTGQPGDIKVPRNFNIDPTGKWILVASEQGNTVRVIEWDNFGGNGKMTGEVAKVSRPVCVKFLAVPK